MVAEQETSFPTATVFGFRVAALATNGFLEKVLAAASRGSAAKPLSIGYLNAAQVNLTFDDAGHARRLAAMDWLYADGQAIVWAAQWFGDPIPERINAGDFTQLLMERLAARGLTLGLLGGRPGEAEAAADHFRKWAPGLQIVFTHHGFFTEGGMASVREALEIADPDLVLIAMGAPRQERWALEWSKGGKPRVWWCVGALLEYHAGTRQRAPIWMRRMGLEWIVRLALEPGRLWKRYLIGNPIFVWRTIRRIGLQGSVNSLREEESCH